jgi:hypothetical protein
VTVIRDSEHGQCHREMDCHDGVTVHSKPRSKMRLQIRGEEGRERSCERANGWRERFEGKFARIFQPLYDPGFKREPSRKRKQTLGVVPRQGLFSVNKELFRNVQSASLNSFLLFLIPVHDISNGTARSVQ